jgi:hypothetical protein
MAAGLASEFMAGFRRISHIERMFGQLKINRAIVMRYGPLVESFLSMVCNVTARYWLKFVHAAQRGALLRYDLS